MRGALEAVADCAASQVEHLAVAVEQEHRVGVGEHCVDLERELLDASGRVEFAAALGRK